MNSGLLKELSELGDKIEPKAKEMILKMAEWNKSPLGFGSGMAMDVNTQATEAFKKPLRPFFDPFINKISEEPISSFGKAPSLGVGVTPVMDAVNRVAQFMSPRAGAEMIRETAIDPLTWILGAKGVSELASKDFQVMSLIKDLKKKPEYQSAVSEGVKRIKNNFPGVSADDLAQSVDDMFTRKIWENKDKTSYIDVVKMRNKLWGSRGSAGIPSKGVGDYQHILRKGTDINKLKSEGFKGGIGPNAMVRWDGTPTNTMQKKYAPQDGDQILYIPKEWIIDSGNGPKIKDGFKPTDANIVTYKTPTPQEGVKAPLRPESIEQVSASPIRPTKGWTSDVGSMPGEPSLIHKNGAVIERADEQGNALYEAVDNNAKSLGLFPTIGEAQKMVEQGTPQESKAIAEQGGGKSGESLYHETGSVSFLNTYADASGLNVASEPSLALGQSGKGIVFEFDKKALLGGRGSLRNIKKPSTEFVGQKEFAMVGGQIRPEAIKSIIIKQGVTLSALDVRKLNSAIKNGDFTKEVFDNGDIKFTNSKLTPAEGKGKT